MKIAISAESTIDMPKELLKQFDISTVPFSIILGEKEYLDGEIDNETIYNFVKENNVLPKTSAVNKFQYQDHFTKLLKTHDAVIHFTLSSDMSSAYSNAKEVAGTCSNVYVIDSRSLSTGIALLAIKAKELADEGKTALEIVHIITETIPKVQTSFILNKLDYLHKGGRCSSLTLLGANLFSIKPQIVVDGGKMRVGKKYMGKIEKLVSKYCADTLAACPKLDKKHAFVTVTTASEEMIATATNYLKEAGFENIHHTTAGGTITSHCGPYTLGILFIKG